MDAPAAPAPNHCDACIEVWDYDAEQWELIEQHTGLADAIRQVEHHLDAVTQSAILLGLTPGGVRVLTHRNGPTVWELK